MEDQTYLGIQKLPLDHEIVVNISYEGGFFRRLLKKVGFFKSQKKIIISIRPEKIHLKSDVSLKKVHIENIEFKCLHNFHVANPKMPLISQDKIRRS